MSMVGAASSGRSGALPAATQATKRERNPAIRDWANMPAILANPALTLSERSARYVRAFAATQQIAIGHFISQAQVIEGEEDATLSVVRGVLPYYKKERVLPIFESAIYSTYGA